MRQSHLYFKTIRNQATGLPLPFSPNKFRCTTLDQNVRLGARQSKPKKQELSLISHPSTRTIIGSLSPLKSVEVILMMKKGMVERVNKVSFFLNVHTFLKLLTNKNHSNPHYLVSGQDIHLPSCNGIGDGPRFEST